MKKAYRDYHVAGLRREMEKRGIWVHSNNKNHMIRALVKHDEDDVLASAPRGPANDTRGYNFFGADHYSPSSRRTRVNSEIQEKGYAYKNPPGSVYDKHQSGSRRRLSTDGERQSTPNHPRTRRFGSPRTPSSPQSHSSFSRHGSRDTSPSASRYSLLSRSHPGLGRKTEEELELEQICRDNYVPSELRFGDENVQKRTHKKEVHARKRKQLEQARCQAEEAAKQDMQTDNERARLAKEESQVNNEFMHSTARTVRDTASEEYEEAERAFKDAERVLRNASILKEEAQRKFEKAEAMMKEKPEEAESLYQRILRVNSGVLEQGVKQAKDTFEDGMIVADRDLADGLTKLEREAQSMREKCRAFGIAIHRIRGLRNAPVYASEFAYPTTPSANLEPVNPNTNRIVEKSTSRSTCEKAPLSTRISLQEHIERRHQGLFPTYDEARASGPLQSSYLDVLRDKPKASVGSRATATRSGRSSTETRKARSSSTRTPKELVSYHLGIKEEVSSQKRKLPPLFDLQTDHSPKKLRHQATYPDPVPMSLKELQQFVEEQPRMSDDEAKALARKIIGYRAEYPAAKALIGIAADISPLEWGTVMDFLDAEEECRGSVGALVERLEGVFGRKLEVPR